METQQNPRERVLDLFGKNMADHFELAASFPENDRPSILDILYTQIDGWISFFRGEKDVQLYLKDDESHDLIQLIREPEVLKSCLAEFRDNFDAAVDDDRVVTGFVKKYARECDGDRLRDCVKILTGANIWDGEGMFDSPDDEDGEEDVKEEE